MLFISITVSEHEYANTGSTSKEVMQKLRKLYVLYI